MAIAQGLEALAGSLELIARVGARATIALSPRIRTKHHRAERSCGHPSAGAHGEVAQFVVDGSGRVNDVPAH